MAMGFLDLPLEIRLEIYGLVFGRNKVWVGVDKGDNSSCLVPKDGTFRNHTNKSSQLLRVNRTILLEARPVLYANTIFHVLVRSFAGTLPTRITDGHPCAPYVKHLIWQLDCDMMKHFYIEDLRLDRVATTQWSSVELRCQAGSWRQSFLGEWCDREAFVKGREQVMSYACMLQDAMSSANLGQVSLIENESHLGRGQVMLRLDRH
jgi:hypothetical protein